MAYKIKRGDTLSALARKWGTTVEAILAANPQVSDPNRIGAGDTLVQPGTAAAPPVPRPRPAPPTLQTLPPPPLPGQIAAQGQAFGSPGASGAANLYSPATLGAGGAAATVPSVPGLASLIGLPAPGGSVNAGTNGVPGSASLVGMQPGGNVSAGSGAAGAATLDPTARNAARDEALAFLTNQLGAMNPDNVIPQPSAAMVQLEAMRDEPSAWFGMGASDDSRQGFVDQVYQAAIDMGMSDTVARVAATQAALESQYGEKAPGNNYFGIKGKGQTFATSEASGGTLAGTSDSFRTYDGIQSSLEDWYAQMQRNWPGVLADGLTYEQAIAELNNGRLGRYATDDVEANDPLTYQDKLTKIADTYLGAPQNALQAIDGALANKGGFMQAPQAMAFAELSGEQPLPAPSPLVASDMAGGNAAIGAGANGGSALVAEAASPTDWYEQLFGPQTPGAYGNNPMAADPLPPEPTPAPQPAPVVLPPVQSPQTTNGILKTTPAPNPFIPVPPGQTPFGPVPPGVMALGGTGSNGVAGNASLAAAPPDKPLPAPPPLVPPPATTGNGVSGSASLSGLIPSIAPGQAAPPLPLTKPSVNIASGKIVPIGTQGTAQGGRYGYSVHDDGSIWNNVTGRMTAPPTQQTGAGSATALSPPPSPPAPSSAPPAQGFDMGGMLNFFKAVSGGLPKPPPMPPAIPGQSPFVPTAKKPGGGFKPSSGVNPTDLQNMLNQIYG